MEGELPLALAIGIGVVAVVLIALDRKDRRSLASRYDPHLTLALGWT